MSKKNLSFVILITVIICLFANIFLGGFLSAKLSQVPFLKKFNLFNPQAPIVINNKETVRVSDSGDSLEAVGKLKSRLSTVGFVQNGQWKVTGSCLNITSDGWFMVDKTVVATNNVDYIVVLADGKSLKVSKIVNDPALPIAYMKVDASNIPVVNFAISKEVLPGQKILLASSTQLAYSVKFLQNFVSLAQVNDFSQIFQADLPRRTFGLQTLSGIESGMGVFNTNGDVIGIFAGNQLLSSDVLKAGVDNLLSNSQTVIRPRFGFSYQKISPLEAEILKISQGVRIIDIAVKEKNSPSGQTFPASLAGLQKGDVLVRVNNTNIDSETTLEEILEKTVPGTPIALKVMRSGKESTINITPTILQ